MRWLRGKHPDEPANWSNQVRDAKKRVAKWAKKPILKKDDEETIFKDLWKTHKVAFSRVQHQKCGYCELPIAADPSGGDIDHYRPKARISRLIAEGAEIPGHNSRDPSVPRKIEPTCRPGYFWLAYDWRNYLLACGTCNQKYKLDLFPVDGGHSAAPTRKSCKKETALLLNPYGKIDPGLHLQFDKAGLITPYKDSPIGLETIRTCGLHRETLRSSRQREASEACLFIRRIDRELQQPVWNERKLRIAVGRLVRIGAPSKPHAGMVRILWSQQMGLSWKHLANLHKRLKRLPH